MYDLVFPSALNLLCNLYSVDYPKDFCIEQNTQFHLHTAQRWLVSACSWSPSSSAMQQRAGERPLAQRAGSASLFLLQQKLVRSSSSPWSVEREAYPF